MQILITDLWAAHNAVDRAHLEVLVRELGQLFPGAVVTAAAALPEGLEEVPGVRGVADVLAADEAGLEIQMAEGGGASPALVRLRCAFEEADLVVSAGGLFRPLPLASRLEPVLLSRLLHLDWALRRGLPVVLLGQSLERIQGGAVRLALRSTLARIPHVATAEPTSLANLTETGIAPQARLGAPLLLGLSPASDDEVIRAMERHRIPRGALVVMVAQGARRLSEELFGLARLADTAIADADVEVLFLGTNLPPDSRPDAQARERALVNDDRLALLAIRALVHDRDRVTVCNELLPPRILAGLLRHSRALLGVGTPFAICGTAAGVPTGSLSSPPEVEAYFREVGLQDLALAPYENQETVRCELLRRLLAAGDTLQRRMKRGVEEARARLENEWNRLGELVLPARGLRPPPASVSRGPEKDRASRDRAGASLPASVIIPAFNRLDLLRHVLEGFLRELMSDRFEVIVVDDGSNPPVGVLLEELGHPAGVRLVERARNGGRGAALNTGLGEARGEVIIICDSDIAPDPNFVREHLAFHERQTAREATHLGALEWGIEPGFFGWHLGARGSPALRAYVGPVPWTRWFTDNWSFKAGLVATGKVRFDEAFKCWGWEEIELAARLRDLGVTNQTSGTARGRHLRSIDVESYSGNFRRGVTNLVHLARLMPDDPEVRSWLTNRFNSPCALTACENLVQSLWKRCLELDTKDPTRMRDLDDPLAGKLGEALMGSFFRLAVARGFLEVESPCLVELPEIDDVSEASHFAFLTTLVYLLGLQIDGRHRSEEILLQQMEQLLRDGMFPAAMEDRFVEAMQYWTGDFARRSRESGQPLVKVA
ncbi:MAG: glycosyltransferase [Planctomycetota bacterium]